MQLTLSCQLGEPLRIAGVWRLETWGLGQLVSTP